MKIKCRISILKVVFFFLVFVTVENVSGRVDEQHPMQWQPSTVIGKSDAIVVASPIKPSFYRAFYAKDNFGTSRRLGEVRNILIQEVIWGDLKAGDIIQFYQPQTSKASYAHLTREDQLFFLRRKNQKEIDNINLHVEEGRKLSNFVWTFSTPKEQWRSWLILPSNGHGKGRLAAQLSKVVRIDIHRKATIDYIRELVILGKTTTFRKDNFVLENLDEFQREVVNNLEGKTK